MAVKATANADNTTLTLEIDNGDFQKLQEAKAKWKLKDYQSLLRFMSSIMIDSKENNIWMQGDEGNDIVKVKPAKELRDEDTK